MAEGAFPFALASSFDSQEFEKLLNVNEETININMLQGNTIKQEMHFNPQMQQMHQQLPMLAQAQHPQPQQHQQPDLPHLSRIPTLIPIPSTYEFEVSVPPSDNSIVYNQPKLYIKMNSKMTINVAYRPDSLNRNERLNVRAMIIFSSPAEMHLPVKRCANHRVANNEGFESKDASILIVNDPKATYHGCESGETYATRLSVLVPLESNDYTEEGKITQTIGLEFGCQNSCVSGINRRPTSIVFTLEKYDGTLIGKSAIEFKVCSCPKRDAERDKTEKTKRSGSFPRGKHPKRPRLQPVKIEPEESETDSTNENVNNEQNAAPALPMSVVTLNMPTDMVPELLKHAYNMVAGKMAEESKRLTNYDGLEKCLKDLKKLRKEEAKKNA